MARPPSKQEVPRTGTVVIRAGRIILASDGAAALLRHPPEALHGMTLVDLFAPEERARIADRYERRMRGEPVPSDYEAEVQRADGTRATFGLHVDREGRDVVIRYRDISGEMVRRTRLQALAALGAAIQRERTDREVLERIRSALPELGLFPLLMRARADGVRVEWTALPPELEVEFQALFARALTGFTGRWAPFSRKAWQDGVAFTDDWGAEAAQFIPEAYAGRARQLTSTELARAIAVRIDERGGPRYYLTLVGSWLGGEDVAAVQLFGAQVAAALDAAGAISDLSRRNDELAALNRLGELAGALDRLDDFLRQSDDAILGTSGAAGLAVYLLHRDEGLLRCLHQTVRSGPAAPETCPLASQAGAALGDRVARVVPEADGPGEVACLPLLAHGEELGLLCARFEGTPGLAQARLELLVSFAAHYAGAIQSHQLVSNLRRRVADLTAVHAVTGRIFAVRPGDVAAMLREGCSEAAAALGCPAAAALLVEEDGAVLRSAAMVGLSPDIPELRIPVGEDEFADAVLRSGVPVWSPDFTRDPRSSLRGRRDLPPMAVLVVPLSVRGTTRGLLVLGDRPGRPFPDAERALAMALAGELAMGLENAELHAAAQEQVHHLSLLGELGRTMVGSLELDQVLTVGTDAARRLLGTDRAFVVLRDPAQGTLRLAAATGHLARELLEGFRPTLERSGVYRRVVRERLPVRIEDMDAFPDADPVYRRFGSRSLVAAPLLSGGEVTGVLYVDDCQRRRRFTEAEQDRVLAVASRLAMAVENARLYQEARRRAEELALLHEVGRTLAASLDIETVLDAGVRNLARMVDASRAALTLAPPGGGGLSFRAGWTGPAGVVDGGPVPALPGTLAEQALRARVPIQVEDAARDPRVRQELRALFGGRAYLVLPLLVRDRYIGCAVIVDDRGPRRFTPAEVDRAAAVANQLAVAVENARLYEDLRRSYAQLAQAQRQLIQRERLAALGELAAVVAHEVRNPLGVIFNSLGSLRRLLRPEGDARLLLDIVGEEADRLNRIVGDLLDFARPVAPVLRPEPLVQVVDQAVASALGDAAVEVVREVDPDLPPVPLDAHLLHLALANVAANAVQAMPRGGRLLVRVRRDPSGVLLEVEDTGAGIPEEVRPRIFEPFFTTKATGTGLGLAVVKRIVEGHGGEIEVAGGPAGGTVVRIRLPVAPAPVESGGELG
jgi:PAS domain S-box-containing protein